VVGSSRHYGVVLSETRLTNTHILSSLEAHFGDYGESNE